jgi:hypothetical protein
MPRSCWPIFGATLISVLLGAGAAPAQTSEDAERATSAFAQGKAAAREGDWQNAHRLFQESWIMNPAYDTAANLGYSALKLARYAEAARSLAYALGHFPATGARAKRAELTRLYAVARRQVTTVALELEPAGADVLVDGEPRGRGETLFFDPGQHVIEIKMSGYEPARRTLVAVANTEHALRVVLTEVALPSPAPEAPPTPAARAASLPVPVRRTTRIPAAGSDEEPARSLAPAIVAGGIAAAGLAAGLGFTLSANSTESEADDLRKTTGPSGCYGKGDSGDCARLRELERTEDRERMLGTVGFVAGGLGAAAAITYLLWPSSSAPKPATRASLAAAPRGAAIVVGGRF